MAVRAPEHCIAEVHKQDSHFERAQDSSFWISTGRLFLCLALRESLSSPYRLEVPPSCFIAARILCPGSKALR